ncbi:Aste57867_948 [Aphanomyces stellatus]|uniref:Aste57867_948 protein n=1 Tax=Aphanomyces stellatus TaxID=120398 RepID=A0A485K3Y1_9STRA|nr:hypothetical protein As57867_000947 [Aphanomyces stellatus]VFT78171.1 Aste57867_948 [Aphanomyces stellatus]
MLSSAVIERVRVKQEMNATESEDERQRRAFVETLEAKEARCEIIMEQMQAIAEALQAERSTDMLADARRAWEEDKAATDRVHERLLEQSEAECRQLRVQVEHLQATNAALEQAVAASTSSKRGRADTIDLTTGDDEQCETVPEDRREKVRRTVLSPRRSTPTGKENEIPPDHIIGRGIITAVANTMDESQESDLHKTVHRPPPASSTHSFLTPAPRHHRANGDDATHGPPPAADQRPLAPFVIPPTAHGPNVVARVAPYGWRWPRVSARVMWRYWFFGMAQSIPFGLREINVATMANPIEAGHALATRSLMQKLVDMAIAHGIVPWESMLTVVPLTQMMAIFDAAFEILLYKNPEGPLVPKSMAAVDPTAIAMLHILDTVALHTLVVQAATWSFSYTNGIISMVPEGWRFSLTQPVRALWLQWFYGDRTHGIGPFRLMPPTVVTGCPPPLLAWMALLTELAVATHLVPSEGVLFQLPLVKLVHMYRTVFHHWTTIDRNVDWRQHATTSGEWTDGSISCADVAAAFAKRWVVRRT